MIVPQRVAAAMGEVAVWWAIGGGWSIDLWLDEQTREHHDVEVVIRRRDQAAAFAALESRWELWCLDPPASGWREWTGHPIEGPAFQLQARSADFEFDIFTETADGTTWHFRRDHRVSLPEQRVITVSGSGLPIVRPEVQLLYMAKSTDPKNQHDFEVARPTLDEQAVIWLGSALATVLPGHPWIGELT